MAKLHEILAVEGDLEGTNKNVIEEAKVTFSKKPDHFLGQHRTYVPLEEGEQNQVPDDIKAMDTTVKGKLDYVFGHIVRYLDVVLQKEKTNQVATADLVVEGQVLAKDVPATFLLGLETKLKAWRSLMETIPTLQPGVKWVPDPASGENIFKADPPSEKNRTAKTFKHKVLYEATDKHPAQIEKWEETEVIGKYITNVWSGMISPAQKSVFLGKVDTLLRAVKTARQRANMTDVVDINIGEILMHYVMG